MRQYNYTLGIMVDDTPIPDPGSWNYQIGDLDTSGSRDATGLLHRAYVATKINYEFEWKSLEWEMLTVILSAINKTQFHMVAPDPRDFKGTYEGNYYVGDRTGSAHYFFEETYKEDVAQFSLKLKFIEY